MLELNDEVRWILGRPNFVCADLARILRHDGHEIRTKCEDEQAAVIHWMLCLYEQHGDDWREQARLEVNRITAEWEAKQAPESHNGEPRTEEK